MVFRKRATTYRALSWKMTCTDKASYGSWPPCIIKSLGTNVIFLKLFYAPPLNTAQHTAMHTDAIDLSHTIKRLGARRKGDNTRWHNTGWPRTIGCLICTGHFPRKGPIISGSFAECYLPFPRSAFDIRLAPNLCLVCDKSSASIGARRMSFPFPSVCFWRPRSDVWKTHMCCAVCWMGMSRADRGKNHIRVYARLTAVVQCVDK